MKIHRRCGLPDAGSNTQCPAVATRLRCVDCTAVAEHQCGLPSAPTKNALPSVLGGPTCLADAGATRCAVPGDTEPGRPSGCGPPRRTRRGVMAMSGRYGV